MAPKVENTRDQDLRALQEHVQVAVPAIMRRADQLTEQSSTNQVVIQQTAETLEASKQLMHVVPQGMRGLTGQVDRVALAVKKLEAADRSNTPGAALFKKWVGM